MSTITVTETAAAAHAVAGTSLPYDLRIGVTGHRVIANRAGVTAAIGTLVERLSAILGRRSDLVPLRWTVVSPIAAGADQIVAETVLDQPEAFLEVVLPFDLELYRSDFMSEDDRETFEHLLARATHVHAADAISLDDVEGDTEISRNFAYFSVGQRVVNTCEIIIAVWNGKPAAGVGGTGDVVEYALARRRTVLWIDADHPERDVRVIRSVAKRGEHMLDINSAELRDATEQVSQGYFQQLAYCSDTAFAAADLRGELGHAEDTLTKAAADCGLSARDLRPLSAILPHFVRADLLARIYQRRHLWTIHAVMLLAGAAVSVAVAQVLFLPKNEEVIIFEVIGMAVALGLWQISRTGRWHEKWLHDRYLAERLRISMFVALVDDPSNVAPDEGLPFYPGPQHWLRGVIERLGHLAHTATSHVVAPGTKEFLLQAWIADQHSYNERTGKRVSHRAHLRHRTGLVLFAITFIMAVLHLLEIFHGTAFEPIISFLAITLPVWAGGIHAVTSQLELERVAERSRRMSQALNALMLTVGLANSREDLKKAVREAAWLMTTEAHEWWVLLSFQNVHLHV